MPSRCHYFWWRVGQVFQGKAAYDEEYAIMFEKSLQSTEPTSRSSGSGSKSTEQSWEVVPTNDFGEVLEPHVDVYSTLKSYQETNEMLDFSTAWTVVQSKFLMASPGNLFKYVTINSQDKLETKLVEERLYNRKKDTVQISGLMTLLKGLEM